MTTTSESIVRLAFRGSWRRYQELALAAFQRDVDAGRRRTHIVAPPGSGKTLIGLEIVRRLGEPALVLVPNTAVQSQWLNALDRFTDEPGIVAADVSAPIAVLTYQALCQLDDPAVVLGDLAVRRWTAERAQATGQTVAEAANEPRAGRARRRRAASASFAASAPA
jgi:superfamily II DNA or RNA helicase